MLISEIYHNRPKTMNQDATVLEAISELYKDDVNGLVILNNVGSVVGILSLQDVAGATIPRQFKANAQMAAAMYRRGFFTEICQQLKNESVKTIMRRDFVAVGLKDNIMTVMADFMKNDLYIVPVIEEGKLLGVVTRTEIKKALWEAMTQHQTQAPE